MKKSDLNQTVGNQPEYIVLEFGYKNKQVYPFEEGLNMIRAYATSIKIKSEYNKPDELETDKSELTIKVTFMNQQEMNELLMSKVIDPGG